MITRESGGHTTIVTVQVAVSLAWNDGRPSLPIGGSVTFRATKPPTKRERPFADVTEKILWIVSGSVWCINGDVSWPRSASLWANIGRCGSRSRPERARSVFLRNSFRLRSAGLVAGLVPMSLYLADVLCGLSELTRTVRLE